MFFKHPARLQPTAFPSDAASIGGSSSFSNPQCGQTAAVALIAVPPKIVKHFWKYGLLNIASATFVALNHLPQWLHLRTILLSIFASSLAIINTIPQTKNKINALLI